MDKEIQEEGKELRGINKRLREILLFLVKLSSLSLLMYMILWFGDLTVLQRQISGLSFEFLKILGMPVERSGTVVSIQNFTFLVNEDCVGWKGLIFFTALVFSVRIGLRQKIKAMMVSLPVIYSINLLRVIVLMLGVYTFGGEVYGILHTVLWQAVMIVTVLILWLSWLRRTKLIT